MRTEFAAALFAVLSLTGCPREPDDAPPVTDPRPCGEVRDCNDGRSCGILTACVGGYCEAGASLEIPCRP
jgi:hypothetical protein